jgi:ParB-like chromosome segregation protein Spo0J
MIEVIHTIQIPVSQLVPNNGQIDGIPKNPRFIRNERFEKLVKSIQDNPEFLGARELIVHKQGDKYIVLCGNMRFRAAKDLRFDSLPCKVIPEYFSLEQIKAIIIKDNISFGSDDMEALANEWEVVDLIDWGYDYTNFENDNESEVEQKDNSKVISGNCPTCGQKIDNETPF